jgi:predicted PhzF superfamily epimerase YddE/YHI9
MQEQEYTCWRSGEEEAMGRMLKASGPEAAAKKAADIWLHEGSEVMRQGEVAVKVRDPDDEIHEVRVNAKDLRQ